MFLLLENVNKIHVFLFYATMPNSLIIIDIESVICE